MPRLRVNYKFTVLHTVSAATAVNADSGLSDEVALLADADVQPPSLSEEDIEDIHNMGDPNLDDSNENDSDNEIENDDKSNYNKREGPCEADIEESKIAALMRRTITNGKVRKIVGTVLAIQSWPYNVKKEPPMVTSNIAPAASDVSTVPYCTVRDVM